MKNNDPPCSGHPQNSAFWKTVMSSNGMADRCSSSTHVLNSTKICITLP
jgi:hypothetical protein